MFVMAFVSMKGGSGKTTLCTNVAAAVHGTGQRVLILDADPQGSALAFCARGAEMNHDTPSCFAVDGSALRRDVDRLRPSWDLICIDSPARLGKETRNAILAADMTVLPVTPGPYDLWAARETAEIIEEARASKDVIARSVLNRTSRTKLAQKTERALSELGIDSLDTTVGSRTVFGEAALVGRGVVSHAPTSDAARDVRRLVSAIFAAHEGVERVA